MDNTWLRVEKIKASFPVGSRVRYGQSLEYEAQVTGHAVRGSIRLVPEVTALVMLQLDNSAAYIDPAVVVRILPMVP